MLPILLLVLAQPGPNKACPSTKDAKMVLVVAPSDPGLSRHLAPAERAVRAASKGLFNLMAKSASDRAVSSEGGQEAREKVLLESRVQMQRAEERFRELDDEVALSIIANVTTKLTAVQQEPGAIELSAKAHLLAGAIYLARDRVDAARQRLRRALDLDPQLQPAADRFSPRLLAEMAAVRTAEGTRPVGRLLVKSGTPGVEGEVFLDGRSIGKTPVTLDAVGAGRHLLLVSAPGRLSHATNVEVTTAKDVELAAPLDVDQEVETVRALMHKIREGEDLGPSLKLLERRANADRVLLAELRLAPRLTSIGTATISVTFQLPGVGRTYADSARPEALIQALERLKVCTIDPLPADLAAPSILGIGAFDATAEPIPEAKAVWEKPWFWAAFGVAALSVAGGLAAIRAAQGPPEAVEITLSARAR